MRITGYNYSHYCSLAYFSDEKIPYRLEAMEDFDVVALVSRPSIMKPYVSFDDNRNFELMHIDDSLYGTFFLFRSLPVNEFRMFLN